MKGQSLLATFNASATIRLTLESVFRQTVPADEVLVLDDGSTDETVSILNSYGSKISVFVRTNGELASARNELCARTLGDLIAFLDHDDLWHPRYLEFQRSQFRDYPEAVGYFTGHTDIYGYGAFAWDDASVSHPPTQVIGPMNFLRSLHREPGTFISPSFFCMPRCTLVRLGSKPFCEQVSGADDCYLYKCLVLLGPVAYSPQFSVRTG